MPLSFLLLSTAGLFYGASFVANMMALSSSSESDYRPAATLMRIGFLFATFYFGAEAIEHGFFLPVINFSQAMAFFAWSLAFIYLVLLVRTPNESFGFILSPILSSMLVVSSITQLTMGDMQPPKPFLLNPYFTLHIVSAFFAYASFTLSFAAGILYLIQHHELKSRHAGHFYHKLPSLEELERLIYQPLFWGAPLLLAAMGVGFFWSKSAFGEYWFFDPKTIATAVTIFLYFGLLFFRYAGSLRGKQGALWSLLAFSLVIFTFVGIRFLGTSHQFAH